MSLKWVKSSLTLPDGPARSRAGSGVAGRDVGLATLDVEDLEPDANEPDVGRGVFEEVW